MTTPDRERQIDEMLARDAIRDLVARYNANGDTGRFERVFELFRPDAVMEIVDGDALQRYDGLEAITSIFTGTKQRIGATTASAPPTYLRHFTATHQIDLIDADHASGRCYFAVLMAHGLDHWGRYVDSYVRVDGQWQFARRKVTVDGRGAQSAFGAAGASPAG